MVAGSSVQFEAWAAKTKLLVTGTFRDTLAAEAMLPMAAPGAEPEIEATPRRMWESTAVPETTMLAAPPEYGLSNYQMPRLRPAAGLPVLGIKVSATPS